MSSLRSISFSLAVAMPPALPVFAAQAPCSEWGGGFSPPGVDGRVLALTSYDPPGAASARLVAAGEFTRTQTSRAEHIAAWDGSSWSALGAGTDGPVWALCAFDDGGGAALFAGGSFGHAGTVAAASIARWDGAEWSALAAGLLGGVRALAVFDDGTGPALHAGGEFTVPGEAAPTRLARWNGTQWSSVGGGLDGQVLALAVFDDGQGEALFAGGQFTHAGGLPVNYVARWDGVAWSALQGGANSSVFALAGHADQDGAFLYAGGDFAGIGSISAEKIARWNGAQWSALGSGLSNRVRALCSFDDGSGAALHVGGDFTESAGVTLRRFARWRDGAWSALGAGTNASVDALAAYDDGVTGARVFAGGAFLTGDVTGLNHVGRWSGTQLGPLGSYPVLDAPVRALAAFDHGTGLGPQLFVGGEFTQAGGFDSRCIARWNGTRWFPLSPAIQTTTASTLVAEFAQFQRAGATAPELYACGNFDTQLGDNFTGLVRVGLGGLSAAGAGLPGPGASMVVWDDGNGPALWVAGDFSWPGIGPYFSLVRHDGTDWTPVFALGGVTLPSISRLAVFDSGNGPELYFAGPFTTLGGQPAGGLARFDGQQLHLLAGGVSGTPSSFPVDVLAALDLGNGTALYVGGSFTQAGAIPANRIARWDGAEWSALGTGVTGAGSAYVSALAAHDLGDGGGRELFAGGSFSIAGGVSCSNVARWDGTRWSPVAGGIQGSVRAFAVLDDGSEASLFAGGSITQAGGVQTTHVTQLLGCGPISSFCAGDAMDAHVTTPCPCGNFGGGGRGCAWSGNPAGASLATSGTRAPDTLVLHASGMPASAGATVFWKGDALLPHAVPWGDGLRCIDGSLIRLGTKTNAGGAAQYPEGANAPVSVRGQTPVGSGAVGYYQTSYRNAASFCTPFTYNTTNGVRVVW